jgi:glycosyltransferase 2 family protein
MADSVAPAAPAPARGLAPGRKQLVWPIVRVVVTLGAFACLFAFVPVDTLLAALGRARWPAIVAAVVLQITALGLASVRWALLLSAYGASQRPGLLSLFRLHWIGLFYNTYVPGGIGGDVVRAVATRDAFGAQESSGAVTIVLIERVLGLTGLIILSGVALWFRPLPGLESVKWYALLALGAACGAIGAVAVARRLAPHLPGSLRGMAARLPALVRPSAFAISVALSVGTHFIIAATGHTLVVGLAPQVTFADSAVMIPLSQAGIYLPITWAGAGAADTAMIYLYGLIGVPPADVLAASLLMLGSRLIAAGGGGLWGMWAGVRPSKRAD